MRDNDSAPSVAGDSDAVQASFDAWTSIPGLIGHWRNGPETVANGLDKVNLITFSDRTYAFDTTLAVGLTTLRRRHADRRTCIVPAKS
jgi:hypothetical protein